MNIRPFIFENDLMLVALWWQGHGANIVMPELLPRGWIAEEAGVPIAVSFLYVGDGKVGLIEYTTTNPDFSGSRQSLNAVKGLWNYLEAVAYDEGCSAIFTLVAPDSHEEREFTRRGFSTDEKGMHKLLAKVLKREEVICR